MRVEILEIHPRDDFSDVSELLIGIEGDFVPDRARGSEWYGGDFEFDEPISLLNHGRSRKVYFFAIRYKLVKEKEKVFTGPATLVKCLSNEGYDNLLTPGKNYEVLSESRTLYHIRTNRGYMFFFPKDKFMRLA